MAGIGVSSTHEPGWPRPDLLVSLAALVVAVALSITLGSVGRAGLDPLAAAAVGYLAFWIPLLGAAAFVRTRHWRGPHPVAWRLSPLDVLWGLGAGLLLRAASASLELAIRGTVAAPSVVTPVGVNGVETIAIIAITLIAPVVLAPVVEELFFRGTLLGSLRRPGKGMSATVVAVVASSLLFALPHVIGATSAQDALVPFTGAAILGLGTGALAVATGRIGAPIVAHVSYNAALLLLLVV